MPNTPFHTWLGRMFGENTPVDLDGDTIKARLVSSDDWTPAATPADMTGIPSYNGIADQTLAGTAISGTSPKVFDANDSVFPNVVKDAAKLIDLIVIWKDDAANGIPLWWYALGVAVDPNGTDVTVTWNAGGLATIAGA